MKPKTIITAALLLFVTVSVVYLVAARTDGPEGVSGPAGSTAEESRDAGEPGASPQSQPGPAGPVRKVVAYYFYGNVRCATCRRFETWTAEALKRDFAAEMSSGALDWRLINVDSPGNAHFMKDYRLYTKSVVVAEFIDGRQGRWRNLEKIWQLARNELDFKRYVHDEVAAFLEE